MQSTIVKVVFGSLIRVQRYLPWMMTALIVILVFVLRSVIKYRRKVISVNLFNSFGGEMSKDQIDQLTYNYYDVLGRYVREILHLQGLSKSQISDVIYLKNVKEIMATLDQKSIILMASHYGNWEVNMVALPALLSRRVIGFYKPISSDAMHEVMTAMRSKFGLELYPIEQTVRKMAELKNEKIVYIFISDQTPVNMNGVYWATFLHQMTPWVTGAGKLGKRFAYPIYYMHQTPIKRGHWYDLSFSEITSRKDIMSETDIMDSYIRYLSDEIAADPVQWLWSHKRWKRAHLYEG